MFTRFGLEEQIDRIYQRRVPLPTGGSVVIEQTEALTAIDVNSGSSTQSGSQEETALRINLEAAKEVTRQLRLRDIGGLIVVDFIDMARPGYRKQVEKAVRDALKADKSRTRISRISANGLLEINRQRLRQSVAERHFVECPTCQGRGRIPNLETHSMQLLRRLEARAATGNMKSVVVRLHPAMADTFQNSRRRELAALEEEFGIRIDVKASPVLERLDEDVQWTSLSKDERAELAQGTGAASPSVTPAHVAAAPARREEAPVAAAEITAAAPAPAGGQRRQERGGTRGQRGAPPARGGGAQRGQDRAPSARSVRAGRSGPAAPPLAAIGVAASEAPAIDAAHTGVTVDSSSGVALSHAAGDLAPADALAGEVASGYLAPEAAAPSPAEAGALGPADGDATAGATGGTSAGPPRGRRRRGGRSRRGRGGRKKPAAPPAEG
jgi:ribonuclease E